MIPRRPTAVPSLGGRMKYNGSAKADQVRQMMPSSVSEVAARLSIGGLRIVLGHDPRVPAPATL